MVSVGQPIAGPIDFSKWRRLIPVPMVELKVNKTFLEVNRRSVNASEENFSRSRNCAFGLRKGTVGYSTEEKTDNLFRAGGKNHGSPD